MPRLLFRFENMPERHAELAWRFGEPDEAFESDAEEGAGSRWVLVSPLPPEADAAAHLTWASELLHPHEAFVRELISLGGRVIMRLHCEPAATEIFLQISTRLFLPMAHAGVLLELSTGSGH